MAAARASTSASVTICAITRARLAPSAWRTTISDSRIAVRAKISVATFADTAPSSSRTMAWTARSSSRSGSPGVRPRSEEHTSELQSLTNLVCRLLLEKKKHNKLYDEVRDLEPAQ